MQRLRTKVGESPSFSTPGVGEQVAPGYHPITPQAAPFTNGDIKTDSEKTQASDVKLTAKQAERGKRKPKWRLHNQFPLTLTELERSSVVNHRLTKFKTGTT